MPSKKKSTPPGDNGNVEELVVRARAGDTRAQAKRMAMWLDSLSRVPAPIGDPLIERMWKVYRGSATEQRRNFLRWIDLYAAHVGPNNVADDDLAEILRAWPVLGTDGPKRSTKQRNVWDLIAARWLRTEGELVAADVFRDDWSRMPADEPSRARPHRDRSRKPR